MSRLAPAYHRWHVIINVYTHVTLQSSSTTIFLTKPPIDGHTGGDGKTTSSPS